MLDKYSQLGKINLHQSKEVFVGKVKAKAKATEKKTVAPAKKKAVPVVPVAEEKKPAPAVKAGRDGIGKIIIESLLAGKFTDEEIVVKVRETMPEREEKKIMKMINDLRWNINQGRIKWASTPKDPIIRLVRVDGKLVPKSDAPKKSGSRKAKPKYTPETDPLNTIAGIDTTSDEYSGPVTHESPTPKKKAPPKRAPAKRSA